MKLPKLKIEKLFHTVGNEMYGYRSGRNNFRRYLRFDLGLKSYRITIDRDYKTEFNDNLYHKLNVSNRVVIGKFMDSLLTEASERAKLHNIDDYLTGKVQPKAPEDVFEKVWCKAKELIQTQ